jgi:hypothetical protein
MKPIRHKAATATTLALLALGGTLVATPPASAAASGTYNGACGQGYDVVASTPIQSSPTKVIGTTYVTYNSAAEQMCAVTVRSSPGARVFMEVTLDTWLRGHRNSIRRVAGIGWSDKSARPAPYTFRRWSKPWRLSPTGTYGEALPTATTTSRCMHART